MVKCGIDVIEAYSNIFENKKIGLITSPTGVDRNLRSTIDILNERFNLKALYSPEHGIRGDFQAGEKVGDYTDKLTGIKVFSLYGENKKPTKEMLQDIDIMAIDIQDVGSRYYTYLYTMAYAMEACKEYNKTFVVLDRPNPIGGNKVEGNILDTDFSSFVGLYPITQRYGLTIGELSILINKEFNIGCDLQVVKLEGWKRDMYYSETELAWINPSPNMPTPNTAVLYNGTCLFEGTNVSEGRGTTKPFEMIGAPWIDGYKLSDKMNDMALDGVIFRPVYFVPTFSKYKNELCSGVQIHITNKKSVNAIEVGIKLLYEIIKMSGNNFEWLPPFKKGQKYFIDHLAGTDELRLMKYSADELIGKWEKSSAEFTKIKEKYHIY
ncbi:exo-beta-N-acetylmuramidase NamZ family protein [Thermoanaerobacterium thermosaccharolyticum]|uniref:exo-beta-N-acetylmuramidase NamZ family protein n=1 Tax=Thermoanaerobacterium thermosaccharolyticum TaxID=1517 RepID=UPI003DA8E47C